MMRLLITFKMAFRALRRNTMRSLLTALGIIIGVGAVIAMVSIGNGAKSIVEANVASLGQNLITVFPGNLTTAGVRSGAGGGITLIPEDADLIAELPGVAGVSAMRNAGGMQVLANGLNWRPQRIEGVGPDFPYIRNWRVEQGTFFDETDVKAFNKVAVIGKTVVDNLFPDVDPIGQTIRIGQVPFRVIGVMSMKGFNLQGSDQDDTIILPYLTVMKRLSRTTFLSQIVVQASDPKGIAKVKEDITTAMLERRGTSEPDFTVRDQEEIAAAANVTNEAMTTLLGMIAGVSLLVGGIGIMNIMLVSVTERTREIGIRLALGAHGKDVLTQFLIEAVALSSFGGIMGVILGVGGAELAGHLKGWAVVPDTFSIILSVGFSAVVGVFFGFYPARKAAQLDPIEALRYE